MSTPTLINLPPPPSDPVTPSDMGPSTPNSGTTSLSALSTVAIKDGHQGATRHPHSRRPRRSSNASEASTTTLDAERADRISRLAGLERVSAADGAGNGGLSLNPSGQAGLGYFDSMNPNMAKERSTVGSASATTGSAGARHTWASGSDTFDQDRLGDDDGTSSVGGLSDEGNASLVGFGEGANSTLSGPISAAPTRLSAISRQSSAMAAAESSSPTSGHFSNSQHAQQVDSPTAQSPTGSNTPEPLHSDAQMVDGMTYDENVIDTTDRSPLPVSDSPQPAK
ncbi:hypothetical protein FQN57_005654 [Myotisia sp. PD_48]|nr:hypothetical protein FQN57_005654 [Myotisia sp. PD_48]